MAVNDLGSESIEILLEVFFDVPDEPTELAARDELIVAILRLAEQLGVVPISRSAAAKPDEVDGKPTKR